MRYGICTIVVMGCAMASHGATSNTLNLVDDGFRFGLGQILKLPQQSLSPRLHNQGGRDFQIQRVTGFAPHLPGDPAQWSSHPERMSLTQQWWYYRANGDTREYGLVNQASYTQVSNNTAEIVYNEPVNDGGTPQALRFTLTYRLDGNIAQTSALVTADWTIENTSGVEQSVEFFCMADPNPGGSSSPIDQWSYTPYATHAEFRINDAADIQDVYMTFGSLGDADSQLDRWASTSNGSNSVGSTFIFNRFTDTAVDVLSNERSTSSPLTTDSSGFAGSMQWSLTIPAGGSVSGTMYMGYNATIPAPGATAVLLAGGLFASRRRRKC